MAKKKKVQDYPTETQVQEAAAQVFEASLSSAVNMEDRDPGQAKQVFFKQ